MQALNVPTLSQNAVKDTPDFGVYLTYAVLVSVSKLGGRASLR